MVSAWVKTSRSGRWAERLRGNAATARPARSRWWRKRGSQGVQVRGAGAQNGIPALLRQEHPSPYMLGLSLFQTLQRQNQRQELSDGAEEDHPERQADRRTGVLGDHTDDACRTRERRNAHSGSEEHGGFRHPSCPLPSPYTDRDPRQAHHDEMETLDDRKGRVPRQRRAEVPVEDRREELEGSQEAHALSSPYYAKTVSAATASTGVVTMSVTGWITCDLLPRLLRT